MNTERKNTITSIVTRIAAWCTVIGAMFGALVVIDNHFAKEAKVQIIKEGLDVAAQERQVIQIEQRIAVQRSDVDRYRSLAKFEVKKSEVSDTEQEIIRAEEEKLKRLEREREQLLEKRK